MRGNTSIFFEENQLSPGLFSLSLLSTAHPKTFQRPPVRTSMWCYPHFILAMDRSHWFRVYYCILNRPVRTRFRYGFVPKELNLACNSNSLTHYAKGTLSHMPVPKNGYSAPTACKHRVSGTFNSPSGVLFTFPSRY